MTDTFMPHDDESEEAIIGSLMVAPQCLIEVAGILKPEHFYNIHNRRAYEAILRLDARGATIDIILVNDELTQAKHAKEFGGLDKLIELTKDRIVYNISEYAQVVIDHYYRRNIIMATQAINATLNKGVPVVELISKSHEILRDATKQHGNSQIMSATDVSDQLAAIPVDNSHLTTLHPELDWLLDFKLDFCRTLHILAASGHYKTTTAAMLAANFSTLGHPVLYVSQEMPPHEVWRRCVAYIAFSTNRTFRDADELLKKHPIQFVSKRQHVVDIRAHVAQLSAEYQRPGVVIIDTVQKLLDCDGGGGRETSRVAAASAAIDGLKLDTGWLIIGLVQQYIESNDTNMATLRPSRNNVKDAKAIYEDADHMIGLMNEDAWASIYPGKISPQAPGCLIVNTIKNRYGKENRAKALMLYPDVPAIGRPPVDGPIELNDKASDIKVYGRDD